MTDELVRERRGAVLIARLNRPDARNALNPEMIGGIGGAILDAETDPEIRAVVLTGAGDRAFCAGMDLRAFAAGGQTALGDDDATRAFFRLLGGGVTIPVVGANATAVAGGFEFLKQDARRARVVMGRKLRVVQRGTGDIGSRALREVRPRISPQAPKSAQRPAAPDQPPKLGQSASIRSRAAGASGPRTRPR